MLFRGRAPGVLGVRGWRVLPLRGGAAVPAASVGPSPRGGLGSLRPPVASWAVWGKPRLVRRPPGFGLPRKVERVHRESVSFSPGKAPGCLAEARRSGSASALPKPKLWCGRLRGPRLLCWGRSSSVGVCGRPLRGRSVPPRGVGLPGCGWVCRCTAGPRAFGSRLGRSQAGPTRCVVRSFRPEGLGSPGFAEARLGRHARLTEVSWDPGAAEAVPGGVLGCPWTRRR
jgi:hypothetical protein